MMSAESQIGGGRYAADRNILSMSGLNTPGGTKIGFEYISTGSACLAGTLAGNSMSNCGNEDGSASGTPVNTAFSSGQWHNSFELHRIFIDEANDVAYLLSENGDPGDSSGSVVSGNVGQRTILTAAGKPNEIGACTAGTCSQNIAMSFGFVGAHDGAGGTSVGDGTGGVNTIDFNGCVNVASIAVTTDDTLTGCGVTGTLASATNTAVDAIRAHYSADAVTLIYTNASPSTGLPFTDGSDIYTATY